MLDGLPLPIVVVGPGREVLYANPAYHKAFGNESLEGRPLASVVAVWNSPELVAALEPLPSARCSLLTPQRRSFHVVATPFPLGEGEPSGVLLGIEDRRVHGRLEQRVRDLNARLEGMLAQRTAQVHEQAAQLRDLTIELLEAEGRERERLAETLHDHLQQVLVAAQLRLHQLGKPITPERIPLLGAEVRTLLQQAIDLSRSLAIDLSPPVPPGGGLVAGLRWLAQHFRQQYNLTVHLQLEGLPQEVPSTTQTFIVRAVRELLFNVVKHAGVDEATLAARVNEQGALYVRIEDRGRGCPALVVGDGRAGFGLASLRQRAVAMGGRCTFTSPEGSGCIAEIELPIQADHAPVGSIA